MDKVVPSAAAAVVDVDARAEDRPDRECRDPGHVFVQNLRRGHYELGTDTIPRLRLAAAFDELLLVI